MNDPTGAEPIVPSLIVDMDGTLCDVRTIRHLVENDLNEANFKRDFDAFHSASLECPAHEVVARLVRTLQHAGTKVLIVSAREARWGFMTALWLHENNIAYDEMFLREDGDSRPDSEVKAEIAARLSRRFHPVLALDDRLDIIEVWHAFGIPTARVLADGLLEDRVQPSNEPLQQHLATILEGVDHGPR